MNILLIEDDLIDQKAFERFCSREMPNYNYEIATSVVQAKRSLKTHTYDIIITDYLLNDGSAFDILLETKGTPVIFVSGQGDEETVVEAMKSGARDFLIKDSSRNYLKVLPLTIEKILKQNRAEEKLKVAERQLKKLSLVSEKTSNPVLILDHNKTVEWVNNAYLDLSEYSEKEIIGKSLNYLQPKCTPFEKAEGLDLAKSHIYDCSSYTKSGKKYWVQNTLTPILDDQDQVVNFVIIQTNTTAKKQVESALIRAKEKAIESEKAKEHFLANMSHEIRTPLNSIVGFTNLLLEDHLDDSQTEYLQAIKWSSSNLLSIINDILDISKIESGKIELEKTEFNIESLINSCIKSFAKTAVELKVDIDRNIPHYLVGDPVRLNQILTNLISNSLKFTDFGEIILKAKLLSNDDQNCKIAFSISDTGIGISQDKLTEIFNPFTQACSDTTRKYGGTGLGLPIVKNLVELHEGTITVVSTEGAGSKFDFTLNFGNSEIKIKKTTSKKPKLKFDGKKILVVEDHHLNQALIKATLNSQNIAYGLANNGKEAIKMLDKDDDYDIILMDLHMPEMGGIKTTQVIRNIFSEPKRHIPIIAMTASVLNSDLEACLKNGMNDHINKPFKPEELFAKIHKWSQKKENDQVA